MTQVTFYNFDKKARLTRESVIQYHAWKQLASPALGILDCIIFDAFEEAFEGGCGPEKAVPVSVRLV